MSDDADPRTRAARLIARSPHAMPLDTALANVRKRRTRLLDPGKAPPAAEPDVAAREPMPVVDDPEAFASRFWQRAKTAANKQPPPPKGPRLVVDNESVQPPPRQAPTPLAPAERQFTQGEFRGAIAAAAVLLEETLRRLLGDAPSAGSERPTLAQLMGDARRRKLVASRLADRLSQCARIRNRALHELPEPTRADAEHVLAGVRALLAAVDRAP